MNYNFLLQTSIDYDIEFSTVVNLYNGGEAGFYERLEEYIKQRKNQ